MIVAFVGSLDHSTVYTNWDVPRWDEEPPDDPGDDKVAWLNERGRDERECGCQEEDDGC